MDGAVVKTMSLRETLANPCNQPSNQSSPILRILVKLEQDETLRNKLAVLIRRIFVQILVKAIKNLIDNDTATL